LTACSVIISAAAEEDLFAIYRYIAERAGARIAFRFIEKIEKLLPRIRPCSRTRNQARRSASRAAQRRISPAGDDLV
jgi:plasmid stabilization system protein ParE